MTFLTKTYLVKGNNLSVLLARLKRKQINLLKVKFLGEKCVKITIDSKDALKFFAICKNSWYNKELKSGGLCMPFYLMVKKPLISLAIALFFALCYLFNGLFLKCDYVGDAYLFKNQIEKAMDEVGVKKYSTFNQDQLLKVATILSKESNVAFVSLKKWGNSAIIDIKQQVEPPDRLPKLSNHLYASEDMRILKITVYSGTACVSENQEIKKGDLIAKASVLAGEKEVFSDLIFQITAECTFEFIYTATYEIDDSLKANALACAKHALGDYAVRSHDIQIIGQNKLKVTLKYEKNITGE